LKFSKIMQFRAPRSISGGCSIGGIGAAVNLKGSVCDGINRGTCDPTFAGFEGRYKGMVWEGFGGALVDDRLS